MPTRRTVLGAGLATALLTAAGAAGAAPADAAAPATPQQRAGLATALLTAAGAAGAAPADAAAPATPQRRGYAFLAAATDGYPAANGDGLRLAQSYTDQAGLFSTAFTYDNALAVLAFLADPAGRYLTRAAALGDALLHAQAHDPRYDDGRLRQGYNTGPYVFYDGSAQPDGFVRADGTANVGTQFGFTGTTVGDMAWAGIALTALARATRARRFLDGAVRIGEWIEATARADQPLGGYRGGVDGADQPLTYSSTEHNIDASRLFGRLAALTGDSAWLERRARAAAFVGRMWQDSDGFFWTGTNDGATVNTFPVPEDTQTWTWLALPSPARARSLDWAVADLGVLDTADRPNSTVPQGQSYAGVTFSTAGPLADEGTPIAAGQPKPDRNGVWFEGTAHLALALRDRRRPGDEARARALLASIESAQDNLGAGQTVGGTTLPERSGVVSASSPLDTGFGFGYYPYRHTGATAWYLMAAARHNPLAP